MAATNISRTENIYRLMLVYAQYQGGEEDPESLVIDLLTDLRHYCDEYGLNLGKLDRVAHEHYLYEKFAHPLTSEREES